MNTETIKEIIKIFEDSQLAKMELEADDMKIKMEKPTGKEVTYAPTTTLPLAPQPKEAPVQTAVQEEKKAGYWVKAPIVGTFYSSRAAGSTPFVEIGQKVKKGDVL